VFNPENASGIPFTFGWAMTLEGADPAEAIRRAGNRAGAVANTGAMDGLVGGKGLHRARGRGCTTRPGSDCSYATAFAQAVWPEAGDPVCPIIGPLTDMLPRAVGLAVPATAWPGWFPVAAGTTQHVLFGPCENLVCWLGPGKSAWCGNGQPSSPNVP